MLKHRFGLSICSFLLSTFVVLLPIGSLHGQTNNGQSQLWGYQGELWDPCGRLPDFSYAGYRQGETPIPDLPIVADVKTDFGAVGDGITDDTAAFQAAIASVSQGALHIPSGVYVIRDVLEIQGKSHFALRGEASTGLNASVLYFPQSLTQMIGPNASIKHGKLGSLHVGEFNGSSGNSGVGAQLTSVAAAAPRCASTIAVVNAAGIAPGDYIVLKMTETSASGSTLRKAFANDQFIPPSTEYGSNGTFVFRWPVRVEGKSGNTLTLAQPLRIRVDLMWAPTIHRFEAQAEEIGIEKLQIAFPYRQAAEHHSEPGYNGIVFQGAANCWVRDVRVHNADNFFTVRGQTKHCTLERIYTSSNLTPNSAGMDSHYGIRLGDNASDNLFSLFRFENHSRHTIGTGFYPNGNVCRKGQSLYLHLDHHGQLPFANLYSDIDAGVTTLSGTCNSCLWLSGGTVPANQKSGAWQTVWNLRTNTPQGFTYPSAAPAWADTTFNLVCFSGPSVLTANGKWNEPIAPDNKIVPRDLYKSQLDARLANQE